MILETGFAAPASIAHMKAGAGAQSVPGVNELARAARQDSACRIRVPIEDRVDGMPIPVLRSSPEPISPGWGLAR